METFEKLHAVVWKEEVWLPTNVTWDDMKSRPGRPMPEFRDLLYGFPIAIVFLLFRIFLQESVLDLFIHSSFFYLPFSGSSKFAHSLVGLFWIL